MKMLMLAFVAMVGIGFAAAPSMADQGHNHGYRAHSQHHHHNHGHWNGHRVYYPRPVGCYGTVYGPRVIYNTPGIYYSGRNLSFGIGF